MKSLTEEKYSIGEYVFFKMKGYPWWPGHILDIENLSKKQIYYIADPSTNTVSKINDVKNIIKFEKNIEIVSENAKNKKYINSIIFGIENYFEGKKLPKKYEKIIKELKEGKNGKENKENENKKNKEEKKEKKENKKIVEINYIKKETKNDNNLLLLNKKRKLSSNNNNNEKEEKKKKENNKKKKIESKSSLQESKEIQKEKEIIKEPENKKKKVKLEGLEKIKEEIKEKERREQEKKLREELELKKKKEKEEKEKKEKEKKIFIENEDIIESQSISTSSKNESKNNNTMIKSCKNYDFYQIVKYLKRIAEYLDKNQKERKNSYFSIEDKKNFINVMEYLNSKEMNNTIQFLKITNIGNYINYIHEKTKIKEFKELTQKFLENNIPKIQLQLFVENALDI